MVTPHRLNADGARVNEGLKRSPEGKHKNGFLEVVNFLKNITKAKFLNGNMGKHASKIFFLSLKNPKLSIRMAFIWFPSFI